MTKAFWTTALIVSCTLMGAAHDGLAQDWPQWRGPYRDGKTAGFNAPKTWPKELTQKWKATIGQGVATPALVGDKLYVFSREEGNEITRCLDAATGKEIWQEKYDALGADGPAASFSGPRSSPAVADGKVVTLGVRGMLSCLDAATGKKLWRKDDFHSYPQFHPSSSPILTDGLCIAQLGGRENGAVVAYDLASGEEKWRWSGSSPTYASPTLMTVGSTKMIVAQTEAKLIGLRAADGKVAWEAPAAAQGGGGGGGGRGGGRDYKAASPIVDGDIVIAAGRGIRALKVRKEGDNFVVKELWNNPAVSVQFNTPVVKSGSLFGVTQGNELFCINAQTGESAWTAPATPGGGGGQPGGGGGAGGGRGGRGGMGGGGYGSIVDAGSVLMALTPSSQLVVFEPNAKEFKQVASYKAAESQTHAHPVAAGNRLFIKDQNAVTLWTIE